MNLHLILLLAVTIYFQCCSLLVIPNSYRSRTYLIWYFIDICQQLLLSNWDENGYPMRSPWTTEMQIYEMPPSFVVWVLEAFFCFDNTNWSLAFCPKIEKLPKWCKIMFESRRCYTFRSFIGRFMFSDWVNCSCYA